MKDNETQKTNRRSFIKASSTAVAASGLAFPSVTFGKPDSRKLKIGFIGCGGRGTGAATQAMNADSNVELWAMGDVSQSRLDSSFKSVKGSHGDKVNVDAKRQFVGLDAYSKVLDSGIDLAILTTPPGFRPQHFKAAVDAGMHVFLEKPMATDAPGLRSVMESAELAKKKGLSVVAGFCWRYHEARREFYKRIHAGEIGDLLSVYGTYYTGPVKPMPEDSSRKEDWSDIEWQVRNWYNFAWCGGDGLIEQAVHSVDKLGWAMKDQPPVSCVAVGGRQIPNNSGNIFDHFEINYLYDEGVRSYLGCRQQRGCHNENNDYLLGTEGRAEIAGGRCVIHNQKGRWDYRGPQPNMYQVEHDEMYLAIRRGEPINDGKRMCTSTMMALMGRMAAYTGRQVSWDMAMNSQEDRFPKDLNWNTGKHEVPPLATPGISQTIAPHKWG
jgi:predicted dehydrogenase|tara:strand:+ start:1036 stop:2352 length:1317 start_codon:yes stop_codon:yes gene_type:complete